MLLQECKGLKIVTQRKVSLPWVMCIFICCLMQFAFPDSPKRDLKFLCYFLTGLESEEELLKNCFLCLVFMKSLPLVIREDTLKRSLTSNIKPCFFLSVIVTSLTAAVSNSTEARSPLLWELRQQEAAAAAAGCSQSCTLSVRSLCLLSVWVWTRLMVSALCRERCEAQLRLSVRASVGSAQLCDTKLKQGLYLTFGALLILCAVLVWCPGFVFRVVCHTDSCCFFSSWWPVTKSNRMQQQGF